VEYLDGSIVRRGGEERISGVELKRPEGTRMVP
jgi:hypothetical protein